MGVGASPYIAASGSGDRVGLRRQMAHDPMFWVLAVGLTLVVVGGWARLREQRRHVRARLRDSFKRRRGQKRDRSE
jgi:hypothetical protein